MHKYAAVGAAVAVLFAATSLEAQQRPVTFGISGGPSFPVGSEFSDEAGTGYHVQGSVGFTPPALPVGLRADLLWQEFSGEGDGNFRQVGGLLNAIVGAPLGVARGHLLGGVGVVNHTVPDEDHGDHAHEGESEAGFAWAVGAGIGFPFLGLGGVLEVRYLGGAPDHHSIPISIGIRF